MITGIDCWSAYENGHKNTIVTCKSACSTLVLRRCSAALETDNGIHIYNLSKKKRSEFNWCVAAETLTIYEYLVCTSTTTAVHVLTSHFNEFLIILLFSFVIIQHDASKVKNTHKEETFICHPPKVTSCSMYHSKAAMKSSSL